MSEPIQLPTDREPTQTELGVAVIQTHECLNSLRKDLGPVILASKFIIWAGPIVVAAILGGIIQTYASTVVASQTATAAAKASAGAASASASASRAVATKGNSGS